MEDLKLEQAYKEWKAGNITAVEVMNKSNMTQAAFYRKVKEYKQVK
ncbi:resolvase [Bacillus australimaris]|uniref:Resolvase n=1 Tax=Bacillus australimaris TaxID=1326968 RepID=A0ABD4QJ79_9BACI|nr:hypothetical protein [Bacillus australimaris]MBR8688822.1 resolvase [Bacillus australimaris]